MSVDSVVEAARAVLALLFSYIYKFCHISVLVSGYWLLLLVFVLYGYVPLSRLHDIIQGTVSFPQLIILCITLFEAPALF